MNYGYPDDDDDDNYDNEYNDDVYRNDNINSNINSNINNPTTTNIDDDDDYNDNNNNGDGVPVHLKNYDEYLKDIIIDNDALDEAPKMPLDYYNSIDNFLKQGPPKLKNKGSNTATDRTNTSIINKINAISKSNKAKEPKMKVLPPAPVIPAVASKIDCGNDTKGGKGAAKKKKIDIDHNLLLAAFSYVDQISREVNDDDNDAVLKEFNTNTNNNGRNRSMWPNNNDNSNNNNVSSSSSLKQPRSAPSASNVYDTAIPKKKGNKKNSSTSIVKKLRSQTATASNNTTFDISSALDNTDDRRNALDFDALVSNFEQGLTIKKLKADLQDSKHSMAKSLAFMKQIQTEMRF